MTRKLTTEEVQTRKMRAEVEIQNIIARFSSETGNRIDRINFQKVRIPTKPDGIGMAERLTYRVGLVIGL